MPAFAWVCLVTVHISDITQHSVKTRFLQTPVPGPLKEAQSFKLPLGYQHSPHAGYTEHTAYLGSPTRPL
jgi:hypothetical protein